MFSKQKYFIFCVVFFIFVTFITSARFTGARGSFGRDHSGMQSKFKYEVMYDYSKKYKLLYGPEPKGRNAWMITHAIAVTNGTIQSMDYSPDGKYIVCGDDEGRVYKVNLATHRIEWKVKPYQGETNKYVRVQNITYSPNGRYIALRSRFFYYGEPKSFKILDAYSGRTIKTITKYTLNRYCYFRGRATRICPIRLKFSRNSRYIYALLINEKIGNFGGCAIIKERYLQKIDISSGRTLWVYKVPTPAIPRYGVPANHCLLPAPTFDVNYKRGVIAVGGCDGSIGIISTGTGRQLYRIPSFLHIIKTKRIPGATAIADLRFSLKDGNKLFVSNGDSSATKVVSVVRLSSRRYQEQLTINSDYSPVILTPPNDMVMANGGQRLFIWSTRTGKAIKYVSYRQGANVKHTFRPLVNPVYKEFAVVERHEGKTYINLIHNVPREKVRVSGGEWTGTGLYVHQYISFFIRGLARLQLGYKTSTGIRAPENIWRNIWHTAYRTKYYVNEGGELYIKSDRSKTLYIYGGRTRRELNNRYYRSILPRWNSGREMRSRLTGQNITRRTETTNTNEKHNVLRQCLIKLGFGIKSSYMTYNWYYYKNKWKSKVMRATTPSEFGRLLAEIEKNMTGKWIARTWDRYNQVWRTKRWSSKRYNWSSRCRSADSFSEVGKLMIMFRDHLHYRVVLNSLSSDYLGWKSKLLEL